MQARTVASILEIPAADWNRLSGTASPFLRYEFLATLEQTACVGPDTGWTPSHLIIESDDDAVIGAMPLYQRTDSWGEFVFDWAWADAYSRAGLDYYPKLVSAIPFTPATGPRCLTLAGDEQSAVSSALVDCAIEVARRRDLSSFHMLFPEPREVDALEARGMLTRKDCQFHWRNKDFATFDEYLGTMRSAKRKKVRRERRRVAEQGIHFERRSGGEMTESLWHAVLPLYASTFWRRGRDPYLNAEFFLEISSCLPDNLLIIIAYFESEVVGTAICFRDSDTLYGRYWGAADRFHSLHFETCYYQGIEHCIESGLRRFEPGTQGEHKLARGFEPTTTYSAHWLADTRFETAIDEYLADERRHIRRYMQMAGQHVPFRRDT